MRPSHLQVSICLMQWPSNLSKQYSTPQERSQHLPVGNFARSASPWVGLGPMCKTIMMNSVRSMVLARLPYQVVKRLRAIRRSLSRHWVNEAEIIASLAPSVSRQGQAVLVDVGAHHGSVTTIFLEKGWSVIAYEPDPSNRAYLEKRLSAPDRLQLSPCAVSDQAMESVALFSSPNSSGISTLSAFHESHKPTVMVQVVTLAEDLRARGVARVDFLKIDIEGYDFFALKGFDWTYTPRFVLYEFEDRKTVGLGYALADTVDFMARRGYHIAYSVWEPIIEYGAKHRWRGLFSTPPADVDTCWGNVLAFRDPSDAAACMTRFGSRH